MQLDPKRCYQAVRSRDRRFDGRFFTAVKTTGIYCRPICPVVPPKLVNVTFYNCAAAAEAAGFRPCMRCRPETAPGTPAWQGTSAVVSRALRLINDGALDGGNLDTLAARLGIGARQLRRLFALHLGASPINIAGARRVHFARRLIDETDLPMAHVASAAGFASIRQFNHALRATFHAPPSRLRRKPRGTAVDGGELTVRLPFRPPFDWDAMMRFLTLRAIAGIEVIEADAYRRVIDGGCIVIRPVAGASHLAMTVPVQAHPDLMQIVARARRLFDLDADPLQINSQLGDDPVLAPRLKRLPGLRVPGAWDGFELAMRAVLGQQVTVRGATTLMRRLVERFGRRLDTNTPGLTHIFPEPAVLADADLTVIGLPRARAATLCAIAQAVCCGELVFDAAQGLDDAVERLCAIPGVGPWTAHYVAMRALGEPDAFPASDLGLRRAVANGGGLPSAKALVQIAEAWRPWRAYAAMHLWMHEAITEEETAA